MNKLDTIWQRYLNARIQMIEIAIAAGKTDEEIKAVLLNEEQLNQSLYCARTYIKVEPAVA